MLPKIYQAVLCCIGRWPRQEEKRVKNGSYWIPIGCSFSIRVVFKSGSPLPPLWPLALKHLSFWSSQLKISFQSPRQAMSLSLSPCCTKLLMHTLLKGEQRRRRQRKCVAGPPERGGMTGSSSESHRHCASEAMSA